MDGHAIQERERGGGGFCLGLGFLASLIFRGDYKRNKKGFFYWALAPIYGGLLLQELREFHQGHIFANAYPMYDTSVPQASTQNDTKKRTAITNLVALRKTVKQLQYLQFFSKIRVNSECKHEILWN